MRGRTATVLSVVSLCCATAALLYLLAFPRYFNGATVLGATLLGEQGLRAAFPIFVPVLIATLALLIPRQAARMIAAIVLAVFVVTGGFWGGLLVGLFNVPAAVALMLAACAPNSSARPRHPARGIIYTDTEIEEFKRNGRM